MAKELAGPRIRGLRDKAVAENSLPKFYELLQEAHSASDAVDAFDLHSEDAASVIAFSKLVEEQAAAVNALVDYVSANGEQIKKDQTNV